MRQIGIVWDEAFLRHDTGPGHPERPDRLRSIREALDAFRGPAELVSVPSRPASDRDLLRVHSPSYLRLLAEAAREGPTFLDADTPVCPESFDIARLAAGGCVELVRATLDGEVDAGFAFPRPPGHHAERDRAMGFCLINNVAVAAAWAAAEAKVARAAIVDIDVHHGNGTQHIFYDRSEILYVSTHRFPFYPGTGAVSEAGTGAGEGFTVNIPLPGGCSDGDFAAAYERIVRPVLAEFRPELLIVSAGFDTYKDDPLGGMRVTAAGFGRQAGIILGAVPASCRVVFVLEGGYSAEGLRGGTTAILRALSGETLSSGAADHDMRPSPRIAREHLPKLCEFHRRYWKSLAS